MSPPPNPPLVAVDIGNSRIKCGLFDRASDEPLPAPRTTCGLDPQAWNAEMLREWLSGVCNGPVQWWIASVYRAALDRLVEWIGVERPADTVHVLSSARLPLAVEVQHPQRVGLDRLVSAVAAHRLAGPGRPAIVVDLGSAITVDLVSAAGAFCGGAILPGPAMSARALHEFTDQLPRVDAASFGDPPAALGTSTEEAIHSGIFWGAVGAARELVHKLSEGLDAPPVVLVTGGGAESIARSLGTDARWVPHLTLAGIVLAATE